MKAATIVGLYRSAPYVLKDYFEYTPEAIKASIIRNQSLSNLYKIEDDRYYSDFTNQGLSVSSEYGTAFRLYHLFGPHPGNYLDENAQRVENPTKTQTIQGCFKIINEYIAEMKRTGIYDDATIIVTTDHGSPASGEHLERVDAAPGIMFVKPANSTTQGCIESKAPVSHEDWFATVINELNGNGDAYGLPVYDIPEGQDRDRYYYYTALYSDTDGEVALREYVISGNSNDFNNWKLTGRNWDILYSERAVSRHRLSDEDPTAQFYPVP